MQDRLPSIRTLLMAWGLLMAATVGLMMAGQVGVDVGLGALWTTVLLILAGLKSGLILWFYLNLGQSTRGWKTGFAAFLCAVLAFVLIVYLLTSSP